MDRFGSTILVSMCTFCWLTDEIYRVPVRSDGGLKSEIINASFVNVSNAYIIIALKVTAAHSVQGLPMPT